MFWCLSVSRSFAVFDFVVLLLLWMVCCRFVMVLLFMIFVGVAGFCVAILICGFVYLLDFCVLFCSSPKWLQCFCIVVICCFCGFRNAVLLLGCGLCFRLVFMVLILGFCLLQLCNF